MIAKRKTEVSVGELIVKNLYFPFSSLQCLITSSSSDYNLEGSTLAETPNMSIKATCIHQVFSTAT